MNSEDIIYADVLNLSSGIFPSLQFNGYKHFVYKGRHFDSLEAAYVSTYTEHDEIKNLISCMTTEEVRKYSKVIDLKYNFMSTREYDMDSIVCQFLRCSEQGRNELASSGAARIVYDNLHHDNIAGVCFCNKCKGQLGRNLYGKVLVQYRSDCI